MSSLVSDKDIKMEAPDKEEPLIKEYKIVKVRDGEVFVEKINALIKEGWRPQGGVVYISVATYIQAMVR